MKSVGVSNHILETIFALCYLNYTSVRMPRTFYASFAERDLCLSTATPSFSQRASVAVSVKPNQCLADADPEVASRSGEQHLTEDPSLTAAIPNARWQVVMNIEHVGKVIKKIFRRGSSRHCICKI